VTEAIEDNIEDQVEQETRLSEEVRRSARAVFPLTRGCGACAMRVRI
jgi:hypothetical protein